MLNRQCLRRFWRCRTPYTSARFTCAPNVTRFGRWGIFAPCPQTLPVLLHGLIHCGDLQNVIDAAAEALSTPASTHVTSPVAPSATGLHVFDCRSETKPGLQHRAMFANTRRRNSLRSTIRKTAGVTTRWLVRSSRGSSRPCAAAVGHERLQPVEGLRTSDGRRVLRCRSRR